MSRARAPISKLSLPKARHTITLFSKHRFHSSTHAQSVTAPSPSPHLLSEASSNIHWKRLRDLKFKQFTDVLDRHNANPSIVWGSYVDILRHFGLERLPIEYHQRVLRACTPSAAELRNVAAHRAPSGITARRPHLHEVRFQTVIRNIRAAGWKPTLDDYHFILEQFAAVGHHQGVTAVLDEFASVGLIPTAKTYGLCLQAFCYRLTLPCWHEHKADLVREVTALCIKTLNGMAAQNLPLTSLNVDLAIRVLRESEDFTGFENLLKLAYGVDLSYPDRPPLEYWDKGKGIAMPKDDLLSIRRDPLPLSTAALNTIVDTLGRLKQVSKLVQAFEVLTAPLPSSVPTTSPFDEDDEDDFGLNNPRVSPFKPPSAEPNTFTFHMLLKWISKAGHAVFARHYLLVAINMGTDEDKRLRALCKVAHLHPSIQIFSPRLSASRSLFLSVFAEANRDKNMELLKWVHSKMRQELRRKKFRLIYYTKLRRRWQRWQLAAENEKVVALLSSSQDSSDMVIADAESLPTDSQSSTFSSYFTPSSSPSSGHSHHTERDPNDIKPSPIFSIDLDAQPEYSPPPPKKFNIDLHVSILWKDINQLTKLERRVRDVVARTTERIKERLGRRVWSNKNIYFRLENDRRRISRMSWRQIVNFRSPNQSSNGSVANKILLPSNRLTLRPRAESSTDALIPRTGRGGQEQAVQKEI